jgi:REP element-mobilizing transposase RayT
MALNEYGKIVKQQWLWLKDNFDYVGLDEFVDMSNHVHGIVVVNPVGNGRDRSLQIKPLPGLIGAFKTTSSKLIHQSGNLNFSW